MSLADEMKQHGKRTMAEILVTTEKGSGPAASLVFSEGYVEAIVAHMERINGPKQTFDFLMRCVDDVGARVARGDT